MRGSPGESGGAGLVFPLQRADPFTPPPEYRGDEGEELRRCPLSYGGEAWLVSGFRATRDILADNDNFSADTRTDGFPAVPLASKRTVPGHFLTMDPPEHTRLRKLVAGLFTPGRVRQLRPAMAAAVSDLVDRLISAGSPADLRALFAEPLPAVTASEMLGISVDDLDFFLAVARDLQASGSSAARQKTAVARMYGYLRTAIQARPADGEDTLLGILARELDGDEFSLDELLGVANLFMIAGLETTAALLSLTMLSLLTNPAQGDLVRADPARWAGPAVTEGLRYWTLVQHGIARVAVRDVTVAGQRVEAGDGVVLSLVTANRDPSVFADPDVFDISRDARQHLAFGHGVHRCLGAPVAHAQAELAVIELMTRLPNLRLAVPVEELSFLDDMLIYGPQSLPIAWD